MTLSLLEGAVVALSAYVQANIVAKLAALNLEYADAAVLTDIKKWYEGNIPSAIPEFNSICFRGVSWAPEQRMPKGRLMVRNYIDFVVYVGDDNDQRRFKLLCRYMRALTEIMFGGESSFTYETRLEGKAEPTNTMSAEPFLQAMVMPISLYPPNGEAY